MTIVQLFSRSKRGASVRERFERLYMPEPMSGCWLWLGTAFCNRNWLPPAEKDRRSYGRFGTIAAHRFSYELHVGPIPGGMFVCHRCDTPLCVNPSHLFLGTAKDNAHDAMRKGRNVRLDGHGQAKLSSEQVEEILASPLTMYRLSKVYKVNGRTIGRIKHGVSWAALPSRSARKRAGKP